MRSACFTSFISFMQRHGVPEAADVTPADVTAL